MSFLKNILGAAFSQHGGNRHGGYSKHGSQHGYGYGGGYPPAPVPAPQHPLATPDSRSCPDCSFMNHPSAKFCQQCGTGLTPVACAKCGQSQAGNARFCSNCGEAVVRR